MVRSLPVDENYITVLYVSLCSYCLYLLRIEPSILQSQKVMPFHPAKKRSNTNVT